MDWFGGYPTVCHGAMFAAGNSMNLSVLSTSALRRSRRVRMWLV